MCSNLTNTSLGSKQESLACVPLWEVGLDDHNDPFLGLESMTVMQLLVWQGAINNEIKDMP